MYNVKPCKHVRKRFQAPINTAVVYRKIRQEIITPTEGSNGSLVKLKIQKKKLGSMHDGNFAPAC